MAANFSAESLPALVDGASPESSTSLISSNFPAHDADASFVVFFLGEDRVVRLRVLVDNVAAAAAPSPISFSGSVGGTTTTQLRRRHSSIISLGIRVNICLPTTHELAEGTRGMISLLSHHLASLFQYWDMTSTNVLANFGLRTQGSFLLGKLSKHFTK